MKPWPKDAVMLICATPESANRDHMESIHPGNCRICSQPIVYDGRTMRRAVELEAETSRGHRPIKFFCAPCASEHSILDSCDIIVDHRGGKDEEFRK